jgi:hypothetical protein
MPLRPWYEVVKPREDLHEGRPLDASEFAVHLDHVREGRAPADYQEPERFFDRTFLTKNLTDLAASVVRRLSGVKVETSAVFNLTTQFGGGKTHALTLLYHLAKRGPESIIWTGVPRIVEAAKVDAIPTSAYAVFVGTEFDSITGRCEKEGDPVRHTPWGEIAFQLGGKDGFAVVEKHDAERIAPSTEVIREFLPKNRPALILMDELLNFMSRNRKSGLTGQLYSFVQNLSEEARAQDQVALCVSLPSLLDEMTPEDEADFDRFQKLLERLGKSMIMSAEAETSEIIRRRLFEWGGLPSEGRRTAAEFGELTTSYRTQVPSWFPADSATEIFAAAYPFHPTLLSVFERKWQALPRFQQTRGILRLLALWVSNAYQAGFKKVHKDPLIGMGTAPLDDPTFRTAVFEQLGGAKLEAAVTTDIAGRKDSHSIRLDNEAINTIKKARLHRKAATAIFFESNGGQTRTEATVPEIRLAVMEPGLDIGNVETVLEALTEACYFLTVERNRYQFSLKENLNKRFADRRASIQPPKIEERVRKEIQDVFKMGPSVERVYSPQQSNQVLDRPVLTFPVLAPGCSMEEKTKTLQLVETMTREYGASGRTFKSALIWCVAESAGPIQDEARRVLAWEDIQDEQEDLRLDESQKRQLTENVKKAQRDLKECAWRTYKNLLLLGKDNQMRVVDLGPIHSSQAETWLGFVLNRLRQDGEVEKDPSPNFLVRNWPGAFKEWSTKSVRDAFFASPQFPRLLDPEAVKGTIARGVEAGLLAYVGKTGRGDYDPFAYWRAINPIEVEISDDMYIIAKETAETYKKLKEKPPVLTSLVVSPSEVRIEPGKRQSFVVKGFDQYGNQISTDDIAWKATGGTIDKDGVFLAGDDEGSFIVTAAVGSVSVTAKVSISTEPPPPPPPPPPPGVLRWSGEVPTQKWMNFYTKVLSRFATGKGLRLCVSFEVKTEGELSKESIEETRTALRELGLSDEVQTG